MIVQETLFERFFSLNGRMNRKRYFFSIIIIVIFYSLGTAVDGMVQGAQAGFSSDEEYQPSIYLGIFALFILYSNAVVVTKRSHDFNCHGIFAVTMLLLCNSIYILDIFRIINQADYVGIDMVACVTMYVVNFFLLFKKGTVGENKYGPDPLGNSLINTYC